MQESRKKSTSPYNFRRFISIASSVQDYIFEFEAPPLITWPSAGHRGGVEASAIEAAEVEVAAHQEEGEVVAEVRFGASQNSLRRCANLCAAQ